MTIVTGFPRINISLATQTLELNEQDGSRLCFPISTARNGPGEKNGSGCTPRGLHRVRVMIGRGATEGAVFVGRRPTGEIHDAELDAEFPGRDWILTRILWLSGLEPGKNRFGEVDTARRYIYIHGSPDYGVTGVPDSHGCIRMKNPDVVELFERVNTGTRVIID